MNEIYVIIIFLPLDKGKADGNGSISDENGNIREENNYMSRFLKISFVLIVYWVFSTLK